MAKNDSENKTMAKTTAGGSMIPQYLASREQVKVSGTEDMAPDLAIPRIQLAQAMSPQVKKRDPDYITDLEDGDFFHALHKRGLGSSFEGVVLKIYNSNALFDEDNNIDCFSSDTIHGSVHEDLCKDCALKEWGEDSTPPACKTFQNHLVVLDGEPAVMSVRLSNKPAITEARTIRTQAKLCEGAGHGLYAYRFKFESKVAKNKQGQSFFIVTATPIGFVEDEAEYDKLKDMAEQMQEINKMQPRRGGGDGGE